ncbi:MAG TPA: hypothetical protein VFV96_01125 [Verrucomicrobiae bacterium]|nr:hypothetical protein [Verrucomicrobiae bacterium]
MAWFKKKADPISDRARALNAEIAALEQKIKRYESQVDGQTTGPRLRSTAMPRQAAAPKPEPPPTPTAPVFEKVDTARLMKPVEPPATAEHFNEFGVRKYDLPALLRRWREHFRAPTASNPKLVNYLAAGGIQGMRPLRREKRIARNRFLALVAILLLALIGLIAVFVHGH